MPKESPNEVNFSTV